MKRPVGLHIRLQKDILDVLVSVQEMNASIAQSFLINEQGSYISYSSNIIKKFVAAKRNLNFLYFVHAAYWSSLINVKSKEFISLCKEADIALNLESQGIVIHVGATRTKLGKSDQAKYVAEGINTLLTQVQDINILLENSPHAGRNFGGDITDFAYLNGLIEQRGRVKFCIDTAHAFVYGYNLVSEYGRKEFFNLSEQIFTPDSMGLLHINDTDQGCASKIDKHGLVGQGVLGKQVLSDFINFPLFKDTPIILELPATCSAEESLQILDNVISWA
ncbi:TIM barrel protein [Candidatus Dependentiae bacterium]|nr:TIM barrel protein [Candidatus Dependentiae bacterium]